VRTRPLSYVEFVALTALLFSIVAFSTDAMLPAFPEIASGLGLSDPNRAQLVIAAFFVGASFGQLVTGPMSDSYGRKPVIIGGLLVYAAGAVMAWQAQTLEALLTARVIQGLGVSAPRTVSMALVRDLYAGRPMARVMSFATALFVLVPAVAPLIGQTIMISFGWRAIFLSFVLFALVSGLWIGLRQPETLTDANRRPFRLTPILAAAREVLRNRVFVIYTLVLSFGYAMLFAYLSSAQQVYADVFGVTDRFPLFFAGIAVASGTSSLINAWLVMRFGMRMLSTLAFAAMMLISMAFALWVWIGAGEHAFVAFLAWSVMVFYVPGLTFGNLQSLALEPMKHIAGMAAAFSTAGSTLLGIVIGLPIGQAFDGSILPLMVGFTIASACAFAMMLTDPKESGSSG
jgi:DHA1 family bicyclomycin/chloramphenicol resistance-like MFS transporter